MCMSVNRIDIMLKVVCLSNQKPHMKELVVELLCVPRIYQDISYAFIFVMVWESHAVFFYIMIVPKLPCMNMIYGNDECLCRIMQSNHFAWITSHSLNGLFIFCHASFQHACPKWLLKNKRRWNIIYIRSFPLWKLILNIFFISPLMLLKCGNFSFEIASFILYVDACILIKLHYFNNNIFKCTWCKILENSIACMALTNKFLPLLNNFNFRFYYMTKNEMV